MKKFFYYSVTCFLGLFFLALAFLLTTEVGLKITLECLPGKAKVENLSGSILRGWTIQKFDYQNASLHVSMREMQFSWKPMRLLKQDFYIDALKINDLTIETRDNKEKTESTPYAFDLPINIYLEKADLNNLIINNIVIHQIHVSATLINNTLSVDQLAIKNPDVTTTTQGQIDLAKFSVISFKNQLALNANPQASITTTIQGDQSSLDVHVTSTSWLMLQLHLNHYLDGLDKTSFQVKWFVDAEKAGFKELQKLHGQLNFSGNGSGMILKPFISSQLLIKNLRYETYQIGFLKSFLNVSLDKNNKINFSLSGKNISQDGMLIDVINAAIIGTTLRHNVTLQLNSSNNVFNFISQNTFDKQIYTFQQAKFTASPFNISFSPINIAIDLNNAKEIMYNAKIQHGKEMLSLTGNAQLSMMNLMAAAHIASNQFTTIDSTYYRITAAPNLDITYSNNETHIDGILNVLSAHIAPVDFSNTVTLSNDIVYTNNAGEPLHKNDEPSKLFLNMSTNIKKFFINYKGIKATIFGDLQLQKTPETEIKATGQLQFSQGSYKAYGQSLKIQQDSYIRFTQEIDNPQLDITAEKEVKASPEYITLPTYQPYLIVGVKITGTAEEPKILLFSIPSGVSQQDILSYIIFGMPQKQLTGSQMSLLWSALNMLGSSNGSNSNLLGLQRSIQKSLGFSEFGLGSTSEYNATTQQYETGTAFVVGKEITENLTATYNVGLLVPVNVLYLRYKLSPRWSLQTDSSALGNGADIFYTISTD